MRRAVGRLAGVLIAEALGLTGPRGAGDACCRTAWWTSVPAASAGSWRISSAVTPAAVVTRRGGRRRPDGAGNLAWAGGGGTFWRTWRRPGPGGPSGTDPRRSVATRSLPRAAGVGNLSAGQSAAILGRPGPALSVAGRETGRWAVSHQPASIPAACGVFGPPQSRRDPGGRAEAAPGQHGRNARASTARVALPWQPATGAARPGGRGGEAGTSGVPVPGGPRGHGPASAAGLDLGRGPGRTLATADGRRAGGAGR